MYYLYGCCIFCQIINNNNWLLTWNFKQMYIWFDSKSSYFTGRYKEYNVGIEFESLIEDVSI